MKRKFASIAELSLRVVMSLIFLSIGEGDALCANTEALDYVWKEFRSQHPYGFQTVGLKHLGDECVFIISEPAETVSESSLSNLFKEYGGRSEIKKHPFGYDGWLADYVGCIQFNSKESFDLFTRDLFMMLYGTDYKASYLDLDKYRDHTYFSTQNLNYSITAAEIEKWLLIDNEQFENSFGQKNNLSQILSSPMKESDELWYSSERGFIVWCFDSKKSLNDKLFNQNARKFALDSDIIIGAIGRKGEKFAIIARERNITTDILPPLRIEMIHLVASTKNDNLAQSYERYHVFAGKNHINQDVAPIYLSDELWHTEYGNLLNLTDQMLKSWSENGRIDYSEFNHPMPIDWAFNKGAIRDLCSDELTYNWNTAGAGYVIQGGNDYDVYAVNRTGSLPVSYIPGGKEGIVDESINDAEELAYDFFSELNSPELVRVVQYTSLYQIFRYFKESLREGNKRAATNTFALNSVELNKFIKKPEFMGSHDVAPNYSCLEPYVERILRLAKDGAGDSEIIRNGINNYFQKAKANNPHTRLGEIIAYEDGGDIIDFMKDYFESQYLDSLMSNKYSIDDAELEFTSYYDYHIGKVREYIDGYTKDHASFPFSEAAHYIVNQRKLSEDIQDIYGEDSDVKDEYSHRVNAYNERVDKYNASIKNGTPNLVEKFLLDKELKEVNELEKRIIKKQKEKEQKIIDLVSLIPSEDIYKSVGTLNWLLTDPGDFNEPIGAFFSELFKDNHNVWMKSPSIACSYNGTGYGGHNLDSHVTPIKVASNVKPGRCRVNFVDGQRIVSVSKSDRSRVTPDVLRKIERRIPEDKEIELPESPLPRAKNVVFEDMNSFCRERGFSSEYEIAEVSLDKTVNIHGSEFGTLDELYACIGDAVANNNPLPAREIRYKNMSAREVHVQVDNLREYILERTLDNEALLSDFDINAIVAEVRENGTVAIILPQKESTIPYNSYKSGAMEFSIPAEAEAVFKSVLKKVSEMPNDKIDNHFKMMRQIKKELQKHPEIKIEDVKDEYIRLYGFIFKLNEDFEKYDGSLCWAA